MRRFFSTSCIRMMMVKMSRFSFAIIVISMFLFDCTNCDCGSGGGGKPTVIISFDSIDELSTNFFNNQVAPIFEEMSPCVEWTFIPCSTSYIVKDVLTCKDGVMACQINVLHACAAHYYENDQHKLGIFFICMMQSADEYVKGQVCAEKAGMNWKILNACQPSKDAGFWCDNRYKQLDAIHEPNIPGVMYNWKYDKESESESAKCLKTGICNQIKKTNGQCPACATSGGGGGGHGGGGSGGSGGSGSGGGGGGGSGGDGHGGGSGGGGSGGGGHGGSSSGGNGGGCNS